MHVGTSVEGLAAVDKDGKQLEAGDIVEVVVKYRVIKVYATHVLAQKVYDVPANALRKTGESV